MEMFVVKEDLIEIGAVTDRKKMKDLTPALVLPLARDLLDGVFTFFPDKPFGDDLPFFKDGADFYGVFEVRFVR